MSDISNKVRAAFGIGGCTCFDCVDAIISKRPFPENLEYPFIVCETCGNKRCPKATNHANDCTHSNEPNQEGSRYQTYKGPRLTIEEMLAKLDEED